MTQPDSTAQAWDLAASVYAEEVDTAPRANADFPGMALARLTPKGMTPPVAWEHHWTLGSIVSALCQAGLILDELREDPTPFWNQFPAWQSDLPGRLPLSVALWMRRPAI